MFFQTMGMAMRRREFCLSTAIGGALAAVGLKRAKADSPPEDAVRTTPADDGATWGVGNTLQPRNALLFCPYNDGEHIQLRSLTVYGGCVEVRNGSSLIYRSPALESHTGQVLAWGSWGPTFKADGPLTVTNVGDCKAIFQVCGVRWQR